MPTVKQRAEAVRRALDRPLRPLVAGDAKYIGEHFADVQTLLDVARAVRDRLAALDEPSSDCRMLTEAIALFDEEKPNVRAPQ